MKQLSVFTSSETLSSLSLGDELNLDQKDDAAETTTRKESEFLNAEVRVEGSCKRKHLEQNENTLKKMRSEGCVQENIGYDYRCTVTLMGYRLECHLTLLNRNDLRGFAEALKNTEIVAEPEENCRNENSESISTGIDAVGQLPLMSGIVQERNQEQALQEATCPQDNFNKTTKKAAVEREEVFDDTSKASVSQCMYSDISDVDEDMASNCTSHSFQPAHLWGCHVDNPPPTLDNSKENNNMQAKGKSRQSSRKGKKNRKRNEKVWPEREGLIGNQAPIVRNKETPTKNNDNAKTVGSHKTTATGLAKFTGDVNVPSQLEKSQVKENLPETNVATENTLDSKLTRENVQYESDEDSDIRKKLPNLSIFAEECLKDFENQASLPSEDVKQKLREKLTKKSELANNSVLEQYRFSNKVVKTEPLDTGFDVVDPDATVDPDAVMDSTMDNDDTVDTDATLLYGYDGPGGKIL